MARLIVLIASVVCCLILAARAENPRSQYFYRDGVELYAEITGNPAQGTTMIFIHGSGGNADIFRGQVDHFKRKFSTVAFDLRGHRYSNNTATGFAATSNYNPVEWAADVNYVLQQLGAQKVICVGGNFGANVCMQLEYDYPSLNVTGRVLSGGNMLTVGTTAQWPYVEITPGAHAYICSLINNRDSGPAGEAAYNYFLDPLTCGGVFCDQCDNTGDLCHLLVFLGSWAEEKSTQLRKLGCFGLNPASWALYDQRPIMAALASHKKPTVIYLGSENLPFSRNYTLELGKMLTPSDAVRPAGRSTPIVRTIYGHGNFFYVTSVDLFNQEVDMFIDYMETGTTLRKCDVLKL